MNNQQAQGQPPNGHPQQQTQAGQNPQFAQRQNFQVPLFRPEHMRNLPPQFSAEEKIKWENGLKQLYATLENSESGSQQHNEARKKIYDFSMTLNKKIQSSTRGPGNQTQQQPQQSTTGSSAPSGQPHLQAQVQANSAQGGQMQPQQRPQQGVPPKPKLSENLQKHLDNYKLVLPAGTKAGTPEAEKWIAENKHRYGTAMQIMEQGMTQLKQLENLKTQRDQSNNPFTPDEARDWQAKRLQVQKKYADAKQFSTNFRNQHQAANGATASASGQGPQSSQNVTAANTAAARPTMNLQQPNANSAAMQQNAQAVTAAFEAARNQQQTGGQRPPGPGPLSGPQQQNDQTSNPNVQQTQQAQSGQQVPVQQGQQAGAALNIKMESGGPQPVAVNTSIAQAPHLQQRPAQNSPQSAGAPPSATSQGPPRPLSHSAALQQSARTYSQGAGSTPQVMGHAPNNLGRDSAALNTVKMPIPKQLPQSTLGTPQPVPVAPSRPSLSGGANVGSNGMMNQPVMQKIPTFDVQGEGERVMNKKKLDELVRQVTGGGEGLDSGEGLSPDVEEVCQQSL